MSSKKTKTNISEKQMSSFDVFWLRNDTAENRMVINFCFQLQDKLDQKSVNEVMSKWVEDFPRFRSSLDKQGSVYKWKQIPNFDPVQQGVVKSESLVQPTTEALNAFLDTKSSTPLASDKILWEMTVVNNVPWGGCMLMWRVHHCVADGMAIVHIINTLFQSDPHAKNAATSTGAAVTTRRTPIRRHRPTFGARLRYFGPVLVGVGVGFGIGLGLTYSMTVCCMLGVACGVFTIFGPHAYRIADVIVLRRPDSRSPLKSRLSGQKSVAWMCEFATVASLKSMASTLSKPGQHYTVNDVAVAMAGGAFRRYFKSIGMNPDNMTTRCVLPVNIRRRNEPVNVENKFTLVFDKIPVSISDVAERVHTVHRQMDALKNGFEPLVGVLGIKILAYLPDSVMNKLMGYYTNQASMVITNVNVGNQNPAYFGGSLVKEVMGWVPSAGGIGVGVSFISYLDKLNIGLIADKSLIPNISILAKAFHEEHALMKLKLSAPASA